jgi:hypothetical protein
VRIHRHRDVVAGKRQRRGLIASLGQSASGRCIQRLNSVESAIPCCSGRLPWRRKPSQKSRLRENLDAEDTVATDFLVIAERDSCGKDHRGLFFRASGEWK